MKNRFLKMAVLIAAVCLINIPAAYSKDKDSAFDRIVKTKTLRCGYVNYQPGISIDPKTGKFSGIVYDITESVTKKLDLKVEWVEETTWGMHLEGLKTGKYDALCAASFALPSDTLWSETVGPLYYSTIGVWVRPDDQRFIKNYKAINDPSVTISAIDGTIPAIIAKQDFPKAKIVSQPQFTDYTLNMQNVAQKKADITFVETWQGNAFVAKNPGSLVNIGKTQPLRVYHNYMLVSKGEFELQSMLNTVIRQMQDNGEVEEILKRYEGTPGSLLRVAPHYILPQ